MIMGVRGSKVVCPDLVWRVHEFTVADDVPRGCGNCRWWGWGRGTVFRILIGPLLEEVSCVTLNPLQMVTFVLDGTPGHLDIPGMAYRPLVSGGRGNGTLAIYFDCR